MQHELRLYLRLIADLIAAPEVQAMKQIPQHGHISCYAHSVLVSYVSFRICRRLGLDAAAAARGGLLHDLFLYNWREPHSHLRPHAFTHPKAALDNANRLCTLTAREKDIILSHMWPVTPLQFYHSREAFIVSCIDKFCAVAEVTPAAYRSRLFRICRLR